MDGLELLFGEALGLVVGELEVAADGLNDLGGDGEADGVFEGDLGLSSTGLDVGTEVENGVAVGEAIGLVLGLEERDALGEAVGLEEGFEEGENVGDSEGGANGLEEGLADGDLIGDSL